MTKTCRYCGETKPIELFLSKGYKCKKCASKYMMEYKARKSILRGETAQIDTVSTDTPQSPRTVAMMARKPIQRKDCEEYIPDHLYDNQNFNTIELSPIEMLSVDYWVKIREEEEDKSIFSEQN